MTACRSLADQIARYDRQGCAEAKALNDRATLPAYAKLVAAHEAFSVSAARLQPRAESAAGIVAQTCS
jgi:hypothetical protein